MTRPTLRRTVGAAGLSSGWAAAPSAPGLFWAGPIGVAAGSRNLPVRLGLTAAALLGGAIGLPLLGQGSPPVCRSASPTANPADIARLRERTSARIGRRIRPVQAAWTCAGTPALSLPNNSTSSGRKAKS